MIEYVFGAFSLLLFAFIVVVFYLLLKNGKSALEAYRQDHKDAEERYVQLATQTTGVIEGNAAANRELSKSLEKVCAHQEKLSERLIQRPCLKNGMEDK